MQSLIYYKSALSKLARSRKYKTLAITSTTYDKLGISALGTISIHKLIDEKVSISIVWCLKISLQ
jgi:hypothetical protein